MFTNINSTDNNETSNFNIIYKDQTNTIYDSISSHNYIRNTSVISVNITIVENVGDAAFCGCSSIKSIDLSNVKTLGNSAFVCCDSLKIVILSKLSLF
jgi:hypothetical protein